MPRGKLELTWVGKDERPRLEPRVLVEDPFRSYGDPASENMLIFGDNLLALKALEQDFAGRIKCIFIDPPYNTGSAFTHYDDGLEHSIWLSLMRDRLECLKRLMADDGSLWITIDDIESHYLKVLCDEVFGRQNFIANVVWEKVYTPKSNGRGLSSDHDHILVFAKTEKWLESGWNLVPRSAEQRARFKNADGDANGPWRTYPLDVRTEDGAKREKYRYEVVLPSGRVVKPGAGRHWALPKEEFERQRAQGLLYFGKNGNAMPTTKVYLKDARHGVIARTWWTYKEVGGNQDAKREILALFGDSGFITPKPEALVARALTIATNPGDWVLDSFGGSGTTGAVAQKMGRKWIMVELGEHCHTHIIPRMQKVIDGTDQGGISEAVGWKGGGGFKYYRLAETLLVQDKDLSAKGHPVYVVNPRYDSKMLIRAICKIEGFRYRNEGRLHGMSSENRFLHVTTQLLTQAYLDSLVSDIRLEQSLLVYCTRRSRNLVVPDNVEVKKIPRDLLSKCDYEADMH